MKHTPLQIKIIMPKKCTNMSVKAVTKWNGLQKIIRSNGLLKIKMSNGLLQKIITDILIVTDR